MKYDKLSEVKTTTVIMSLQLFLTLKDVGKVLKLSSSLTKWSPKPPLPRHHPGQEASVEQQTESRFHAGNGHAPDTQQSYKGNTQNTGGAKARGAQPGTEFVPEMVKGSACTAVPVFQGASIAWHSQDRPNS